MHLLLTIWMTLAAFLPAQTRLTLIGAGPAGSTQIVYTDNFNRADSNTLGGVWVESEEPGTCGGACITISSNQLSVGKVGGVGGNAVAYYNDTTPNDQYAQWVYNSTAAGQDRGLCVRMSGTYNNFSAYCLIFEDGNLFKLRKCVNVTLNSARGCTQLDQTSSLPSAGDTLRLQVSGSDILAKKNGANYLSATDSGIASGKGGMFVREGSGTTAAFDNWENGGL